MGASCCYLLVSKANCLHEPDIICVSVLGQVGAFFLKIQDSFDMYINNMLLTLSINERIRDV